MHEVFLQSIIESPDDDGPRLVYADWLDEHGESGGAEFIRVQCAVAQMPAGDRRIRKLRTRERAVLKAHPEWLDLQLPKAQGAAEMRRGFVEHVTLSPELFLRHGQALFARLPIRRVTFVNLYGVSDQVRHVAASPLLARLDSLTFDKDYGDTGLRAVGLRNFLDSPHLENLRSLSLKYNELGTAGAPPEAVPQSPPPRRPVGQGPGPLAPAGTAARARAALEQAGRRRGASVGGVLSLPQPHHARPAQQHDR
jgi:uncharacterized protein (TIGR02996 family)